MFGIRQSLVLDLLLTVILVFQPFGFPGKYGCKAESRTIDIGAIKTEVEIKQKKRKKETNYQGKGKLRQGKNKIKKNIYIYSIKIIN